MGRKYRVPSSLTVQKAMEYAGFQIIRGCGCRGGACGACAMVYGGPGNYKIRTGLACVTLVEQGMMVLNMPHFPSRKGVYDIENVKPMAENIAKLYPEIARCLGCNTCTKMCPQDIPVMEVVAAASVGDIQKAADLSMECVMCTLCAAKCPGELSPHYIALLCRRLYGKYLVPPYPHVIDRLKQLDSGECDEEMDRLLELNPEELRGEYRRAQADKRVI
ncbi:MAG: 4Fe-4S dicluster domain-containing protein [Deltaproteobacteria bacterium]|nr:4Fe-4S dicluster domain-containing protein [Deltaproteobacteria bacterium]